MRNHSIKVMISLFSLVAGCADEPQSAVHKKNDLNSLQTGFLTIDTSQQEVQFTKEGGFALLDECTRVPTSQIAADKSSANLTTHVGVALWPKGIVPYVIRNAPADFESKFMRVAVREFQRAGILLKPRTNEAHYLDFRVVEIGTSECAAIKCSKFAGAANSYGFVKKENTAWFYYDKSPNHDGNTIYLSNDRKKMPQYVFQSGKDVPKEVRDYWHHLGLSTLLHEIGHVLGARHEQGHPDAKKFLKVTNGGKFEDAGVAVTNFDRKSVMLYCNSFRSKKSGSSTPICDEIGEVPIELSPNDLVGFAKLYQNQIRLRDTLQPDSPLETVKDISVPTTQTATVASQGVSATSAQSVGATPGKGSSPQVTSNAAASATQSKTKSQTRNPAGSSGSNSTTQTNPIQSATVSANSASSPSPRIESKNSPATSAPVVASCEKISRSPVNSGGGECGKPCRDQLKSAADVLGVSVPNNLSKNSVAKEFYRNLRQAGQAKGCDPLIGTNFN